MPYKDKNKQKEYLRKYLAGYRPTYQRPYMKQYRQFKTQQNKDLKQALDLGKVDVARTILGRKPNISLTRRKPKTTRGRR